MGGMRITVSAQRLVEKFLHLVEEAFRKRIDFFATEGGEVFEQLFLLARQTCRCFDGHTDMLVALLKSLDVFDALAFHAKDFTGLCSGRNFHFDLAIERRHVDLRAQRSLHETDRYIANDVEIITHENRVRFHLDHDIEIARTPPTGPVSPSPRSFKRDPVSTPAGIFTLSVCIVRTRPAPPQVAQGSLMIVPWP